jgi:hypothetical protein
MENAQKLHLRQISFSVIFDKYCGVFRPCKNCNIESRSRDYATVDEAVFSPYRAELCSAVTSRSSPRLDCCQVTATITWMAQEWGGVT